MSPIPDPRHLSNGHLIPGEGYADQPYLVRADDGAWLLVITTGRGREGEAGQHVVTYRSADQGRTWSDPVDVEPADGPEASYAVLLKTPYGRVYCFYNHNTDRVPEVKREDGGVYRRVDSLGHFVFKYSDDGGRSWSPRRYEIPVREFACDRNNIYGGRLRFFWNVGRPLVHRGAAYVPLHKVGAMGKGFFAQSEGALLRSANLLTERDPEKIAWETLPEGDAGLRTPAGGGRISEEQSITALSDGTLYCVFRTVDGFPACAYSRDDGRTWTPPAYKTYTPGGQPVKHPRAANFVWRCANGRFLYWFHNHGGLPAHARPDWDPYQDRNPAWLMAGEERDTPAGRRLFWSQPEILLYDDDPFIRMSYPDLVEEDGRFFITETQKSTGRVHEIPPALADGLFQQGTLRDVAREGLLLEAAAPLPRELKLPRLPDLHQRDSSRPDYAGKDLRGGFTLELRVRLPVMEPGRVLLDSRDGEGRGLLAAVTDHGSLALHLSDGRQQASWDTDPGLLKPGETHHVTAIVDGGPKLILFLVDGVVCDGGVHRQFGWGRYSPTLRTPNGAASLRVDPERVLSLRLYGRALRVSEAVGNWRASRS